MIPGTFHADLFQPWLGVPAFGEPGAGNKFTESAKPYHQVFAALRALSSNRFRARFRHRHFCLSSQDFFGKGPIKAIHNLYPISLAAGNFIEIVLHRSCEVHIHNLWKILHHHFINEHTGFRWFQALVNPNHIATFLDSRHDRRICGRASNSKGFKRLNQRGFGITRRRLGKMLFRDQPNKGLFLTFSNIHRYPDIIISLAFHWFGIFITAFFINNQEARKFDSRSGRTENILVL